MLQLFHLEDGGAPSLVSIDRYINSLKKQSTNKPNMQQKCLIRIVFREKKKLSTHGTNKGRIP
jgi:hypothetical protein